MQDPRLATLVHRFLNLCGYFAAGLDSHMRGGSHGTRVCVPSAYRSTLDTPVTILISSTPAAVFSTAYARDPQCVVDTVVYLDEDLLPEDSPAEVFPLFSTAYARDPQCVVDTVVYMDEYLLPEDSPAEVCFSVE
jgi:hypothetical protein